MTALRKSIRVYRNLLSRVDLKQPRSGDYKACLSYLRSLYAEYGAAAVRLEMSK